MTTECAYALAGGKTPEMLVKQHALLVKRIGYICWGVCSTAWNWMTWCKSG